MPLLEVCLVGKTPMMNYLGSILKKPDAIVWLRQRNQKNFVSHIESALSGQIPVSFESRELSEDSADELNLKCEEIIKDYPEHDIILNASGGTRLQSLVAAEVFKREGKEIVYIDSDHSRMINIVTAEVKSFHFNLTVNEYIALHGIEMKSGTRFDPEIGKRSALSYFIGNNIDRAVAFIDKIRRDWDEMGETKQDMQWRMDDEYVRFTVKYEAETKKMRFRFGTSGRQRSHEILEDGPQFLLDGGWLRELVFLRIHRMQYDDVRLKVGLNPESLPGGLRSKDTLDIAMVRDCKFYVFQCMPYPITKDTFIELRHIKSTITPLNGRGYVFVAHRPHRGFIERSRDAGLEVISGRRISNFSL